MKKTLLIILCFLFVLSLTQAQNYNDYNNFSSLDLELNLESEFSVKTSDSSKISFIQLAINSYPREEQSQNIKSLIIETNPKTNHKEESDQITIEWKHPSSGFYTAKLKSKVNVKNSIIAIKEKVKFPINEDIGFTAQTKHIDINQDIRAKAQELAKGKDDLYDIAFTIGKWVKQNINYDLNDKTYENIQKSSWVYENKYGVCDELTNLFISMLRSLDIPTKFVSGTAYGNIEGKWSSHAWAEVYFPEYGWLPFDVTYGQLGWIDPSHIKLSESLDSGFPTAVYRWKSSDTELDSQKINISTNLIAKGSPIEDMVEISVRSLVDKIGKDSFLPIEIRIKNKQNFYLPERVLISQAPEEIVNNTKEVLLLPKETRKYYWIINGPKELSEGYIYTIPLEVEDIFHTSSSTNITFGESFPKYTKEQAELLINKLTQEKDKLDYLVTSCNSKNYFYIYEEKEITCDFKNIFDNSLKNVYICLGNKCNSYNFKPFEEKQIKVNFESKEKGFSFLPIEITHSDKSLKDTHGFTILESPNLQIAKAEIPDKFDYKKDNKLSFVMFVEANINNVQIELNKQKILSIPLVENSKKATIVLDSKQLYKDSNINLTITYYDENNKKYLFNDYKEIKVYNAPWYVKLLGLIGL